MAEQIPQTQNPQPQPQPPKMENYERVHRPFWKMVFNNFFGGIAWSIGVLIGTTIVIAIAAFFIRKIDFVPIFGHFFAEVLKSAQSNIQPTATPIP